MRREAAGRKAGGFFATAPLTLGRRIVQIRRSGIDLSEFIATLTFFIETGWVQRNEYLAASEAGQCAGRDPHATGADCPYLPSDSGARAAWFAGFSAGRKRNEHNPDAILPDALLVKRRLIAAGHGGSFERARDAQDVEIMGRLLGAVGVEPDQAENIIAAITDDCRGERREQSSSYPNA